MSAVGSILTNSGALNALNSISNTTSRTSTLENQLSTGLSISSPADNPAGYITAQGFTSQLNGITQAISNANQGVSLLQTAQGAITQQIGVVQQLNSIAVQAANGTQTSAEAQSLQGVVGQLTAQVSTIANQTQFNNISLLNGSFNGVQFQVGANEGQTQTLSISNTTASHIGMYTSGVKSGGIYSTGSAASSGVVTAGTAGAFTAGSLVVTGPTSGSASISVKAAESAASIAAAVNNAAGVTGVQAQATNTVTLNLKAAGANGGYSFKIGASTGSAAGSAVGKSVTVNASNVSELVSQINGQTTTNGITASTNSKGQLVLSQASGDNINISAVSSGSLTTTAATPVAITGTATAPGAGATIQGQVQFQSSAAFSVTAGATTPGGIGLNNSSTLQSLSNINVSTTAGANQAINVVKYALAALNNQGGQLGAVQQALTANINNLNTTSQNVTSALGVVQDANIPQVSNQLTEAQIQAQSGVAALKSSTTLQQSFLSLLP
ncbi:MAG: flagellin [Rhodospirillales bacterium 20-64-7]|nr:MAG: flagellin [Rhodospirillales bacterium 20-64-7]